MIRPMAAQDIKDVQQIARITWQATYDDLIPEELQSRFLNRSYSDMMLMKRMEKTVVLIAEHKGVPIGFINFTLKDEDGDAELIAMYILPIYQRQGFGKELLHAAQIMLTNASKLFVYVEGNNRVGRAFYEKENFQLNSVFNEKFEGQPMDIAEYIYTF